ncbi:MAG TPA: PIG-L deacetylase family protein [Streptosporangiaceae bacterium]|nr:PIG-L deacetylase family protein [Streptosporangiaceae bacterium]
MRAHTDGNGTAGRSARAAAGRPGPRPGHLLPPWRLVLAVVAHPDDETFGLGAVAGRFAEAGASVHVLCFTHGEASTLNHHDAELHQERAGELRRAAAELGLSGVTLLDYADGHLAEAPVGELSARVARLAASLAADGLLVFDETGITGHPDHQAATRAARLAATAAGLPVLAWALPEPVAGQLRAETGAAFAGQPAGRIDLCVRVDRARQRRAALLHASQISPGAVLWRRLQLQGDCEHLRWLSPGRPPGLKDESPG